MTEPSTAEEAATPPESKVPWQQTIAPRVFWPAAIVIVGFVLITVAFPTAIGDAMSWLNDTVIGTFSWYYMLLVSALVVFSIWIGLSHYGDIKLGPDDEAPEFSLKSWFSMLFAAGMGIGLVFWGVAEPLNHFAGIPNRASGVEAANAEGAQQAIAQTFLHWGLHPWAIYVVVGVAIAYAIHRKKRPVSIRYALEGVLGRRVNGWLGDVIDIVAIVGTLFGVSTSLGLGVAQVASGLEFLEIVSDPGNLTLVVLIGAITCLAVVSVVTGLKKGIRFLSNFNIGLAAALMLFVLIMGPTLFIFREFVQSVGVYFQNLLRMSFNTTAYAGEAGDAWQGYWSTFYWGWWISWAPFVGVFIARISRGRTVREFVAGVLIVPTLVSFLWFSVLGGTALYRQLFGAGGLVGREDGEPTVDTEGSLFNMLDGLPGGAIVVVGAIILVVLFFVTSSDSGSLVVDMLASGGDPNPPTWSRVFWGVMEGAVAAALLLAGGGGLDALKLAAILIALPFSIVMIIMCVAIAKEFRAERRATLRAQRRVQREELTEHVTSSLIEEGMVPANGGDSDTGSTTGSGTSRP